MTKVITLRLKERELNFINEISHKEKEDRSYAARKLIDYGWTFFVLKGYKEGKISLGKAAKQLDVTISEMIEMLADFGITSPVNYDEYLEGYGVFKNEVKEGFGIAKGAQPFNEKD